MISALITGVASSFRVEAIDGELETFQKLVGGYIEAVSDPVGSDWVMYCNEEGKLDRLPVSELATRVLDRIWLTACGRPFSADDIIVGPGVWLGDDGEGGSVTLPLGMIRTIAQVAVMGMGPVRPISTVRYKDNLWVYDQRDDQPVKRVLDRVELARNSTEHGVVEFHYGLSPQTWVEIRVALLDDWDLTVHDMRDDKTQS